VGRFADDVNVVILVDFEVVDHTTDLNEVVEDLNLDQSLSHLYNNNHDTSSN